MVGELATLAGGLINSAASWFGGRKQQKKNLADINSLGTYNANPEAAAGLALAKNLYNARSAGAINAEQNIATNQANVVDNIENNATDAGQALALMIGSQGKTNNAFADLASQEAGERMAKANLVSNAQGQVIAEGDKIWQDKLRQLQQKIGVRSVGAQNSVGGIQGLGNTVAMFGNMWDSGMFKKK
jgi:hypothetical protein